MEWNRGRVRCSILDSNLHKSECLGEWLLGAKIVQVSSMSLRVAGGVEIRTQQQCFPKTKLDLGTFESHHMIHSLFMDCTNFDWCTQHRQVCWWSMSYSVNLIFTLFVLIFLTSRCLQRPFLFFVNYDIQCIYSCNPCMICNTFKKNLKNVLWYKKYINGQTQEKLDIWKVLPILVSWILFYTKW